MIIPVSDTLKNGVNEDRKARPTTRELEDRRRAFMVLRAQVGDRSAIEDLLVETATWLQPYLRKIVGDPELADELSQEVLLKVYRNLVLLNEPRVYRSWVYRIATRHAFRQLSRRSKRHRHEIAVDSVPEEAAEPDPPPLLRRPSSLNCARPSPRCRPRAELSSLCTTSKV